MRAGVLLGDARNDGVREHLHAVPGGNVALVQSLTDELRVVIRTIVVRLVELVESPVVARERQRCAAHASLTRTGNDPERRVFTAEQELGGRWKLGGSRRVR